MRPARFVVAAGKRPARLIAAAGLVVGVLSLCAGVSADGGPYLGSVSPPPPPKPAVDVTPYSPPDGPRVQGDTILDPFVIGVIPFSAAGSTCGFVNDYDEACPFSGSTAPDVVYRYTPPAEFSLEIDLCASTFDTKVYVYQDSPATLIACNDDYCSWQSYIHNVPVFPGHTYYIVVDGYGSSCGNYYLAVNEWIISCGLMCPAYAVPEGEPDCFNGYVDTYNGGCGVLPAPVFQALEPSPDPIAILGTTGVYTHDSLVYRDTDWYELELTEAANICLSGNSWIPTYFMILDGRGGCDGLTVAAFTDVYCIVMEDLCHFCEAGTWWVWVGPSVWETSYGCGVPYWVGIDGYTSGMSSVGWPSEPPSRDTTWGRLKDLYR